METKTIGDYTGGEELGPVLFEITLEKVRWYAYAVEDFHPWYSYTSEDSPFKYQIVHPTICHVAKMVSWAGQETMSEDAGPHRAGPARMHVGYEAEYFEPARVGEILTVKGRCLGSYEKRGRRYMEWQFDIDGQDGRRIATYKDTTLLTIRKSE